MYNYVLTYLHLAAYTTTDINKIARTATANNNKRNDLAEDLQWEIFQWKLAHAPSFARRLDTSEGVNFTSHTSDLCAYWGTGHDGHARNMSGKLLTQFRDFHQAKEEWATFRENKTSITQSIQPAMRDATGENSAATG